MILLSVKEKILEFAVPRADTFSVTNQNRHKHTLFVEGMIKSFKIFKKYCIIASIFLNTFILLSFRKVWDSY